MCDNDDDDDGENECALEEEAEPHQNEIYI